MENRVSGAFIYAVPFMVIILALILMLPVMVMDFISYQGWLNACMVEVGN